MATELLHPMPTPEAARLMCICGTMDLYEQARIQRVMAKQQRQAPQQTVRENHGWGSSTGNSNVNTSRVFVFRT